MKPTRFPQQTVELRAPAGMTEAECGILAVHRTGVHCISRWQLSLGERLRIAFGGPVWLWVWSGNTQPPVALTTESPFAILARGEEPATGERYRERKARGAGGGSTAEKGRD